MGSGDTLDKISDEAVGTSISIPAKIILDHFMFIEFGAMKGLLNSGNSDSPFMLSLDTDGDSSSCNEVDEEDLLRSVMGPLVFNVDDGYDPRATEWSSYKHFIKRSCLQSLVCSEGQFFDVILQTKSHEIVVKLWRSSFRIVAYRMEKCSLWLEFRLAQSLPPWLRPDKQRVEGSSSVNMLFNYESLLEELGPGETLSNVKIGQKELAAAIDVLAISKDSRERARASIVLRMMLCEGMRSKFVRDYVSATFQESLPPPPWMKTLVLRNQMVAQLSMTTSGYNYRFKEKVILEKVYLQFNGQNDGASSSSGLIDTSNSHFEDTSESILSKDAAEVEINVFDGSEQSKDVSKESGAESRIVLDKKLGTKPEAVADEHGENVSHIEEDFDVRNLELIEEIILEVKSELYPGVVKEVISLVVDASLDVSLVIKLVDRLLAHISTPDFVREGCLLYGEVLICTNRPNAAAYFGKIIGKFILSGWTTFNCVELIITSMAWRDIKTAHGILNAVMHTVLDRQDGQEILLGSQVSEVTDCQHLLARARKEGSEWFAEENTGMSDLFGIMPHMEPAIEEKSELLTEFDVRSKVVSIVNKYFLSRNLQEAELGILLLGTPEYHPEAVKEAINVAVDMGAQYVDLVGKLLVSLSARGIFCYSELLKGCLIYGSALDGISINLRHAPTYFGRIIGQLILAGAVNFDLVKFVLGKIKGSMFRFDVLVEATNIQASLSGRAVVRLQADKVVACMLTLHPQVLHPPSLEDGS